MKKSALIGIAIIGLASFALIGARGGGANSGLQPGEFAPAFDPTHVSGPDAGTSTCPVCKYGARPAVQVWLSPEAKADAPKFAEALEAAVTTHKDKDMKAFVVMMTMCDGCVNAAKNIGKADKNKHVAITYLPTTDQGVKGYKINTSKEVKNTVMVYKDRKISQTFVNLTPDKEGIAKLNKAIDAVTN